LKKSIPWTILFCLINSPLWAFNLNITCSGSGGSWSNGKYQIATNTNITFSCTASNGTANYDWEWDFDDEKSFRSAATNQSGTGDADGVLPNVVRDFDAPGIHHVWIEVTDADSVTETALLLVEVTDGLTVKNAIDDCGCVDDNSTDNTTALYDCVNGAGANYRIYFPNSDTGTYKFTTYKTVNSYKVIIDISGDSKAEFVGDVGVQLNFQPTTAIDGIFHATIDNTAPYIDSVYRLFRNLYINTNANVNRFLRAGPIYNGFTVIEDCKISGITYLYRHRIRLRKSIIVNYGSNAIYGQGRSLYRQNYIADNPIGASHGLYIQGNEEDRMYHYIDQNYIEMATRTGSKLFMQLKPSDGVTEMDHFYVTNNLMIGSTDDGEHTKYVELGRTSITNMHDIKFNDNRVINAHDNGDGYGLKLFTSASSGNNEILRNFFSKIEEDCIWLVGSINDLPITDNTFGYDAGSDAGENKIYEDCSPCNYTETGSTDDSSKYLSSDPSGWYDENGYLDPGEWEYTPPTNYGQYAVDNGSGLGSTERFPFIHFT